MIFGGTSQTVLSISVSSKLKLPSRNYFKVLITLTRILSAHLYQTSLRTAKFLMKSAKFICKAAIVMLTVSFMHKVSMEMWRPTAECIPITVDTSREIKEVKLKNLAYFS